MSFGYHAREACEGTIARVLRGVKGRSVAEVPDSYCSNCGRELSSEDQFCPNCGRPVHETARVPTPEADVPAPPPSQVSSETETQETGQRLSGGSVRSLFVAALVTLIILYVLVQ